MGNVNQTTFLALALAFLIFITMKGELGKYIQVFI